VAARRRSLHPPSSSVSRIVSGIRAVRTRSAASSCCVLGGSEHRRRFCEAGGAAARRFFAHLAVVIGRSGLLRPCRKAVGISVGRIRASAQHRDETGRWAARGTDTVRSNADDGTIGWRDRLHGRDGATCSECVTCEVSCATRPTRPTCSTCQACPTARPARPPVPRDLLDLPGLPDLPRPARPRFPAVSSPPRTRGPLARR